jgi:hemerythrin-like domain-containing protein
MAKRHDSLLTLSRDHHHGLALALRLREGESALLTDGWTHDRKEQARRVDRFYQEELRPHFAAEEEALFPAMRAHIQGADVLLDKLTIQHRQLEGLTTLVVSAQQRILGHILTNLGELLEQHIRLEERSLFPLFESQMPPEQAAEAGKEIHRVRDEVRSSMHAPVRNEPRASYTESAP